jgi:hypothetical protein
MWSTIVETCDGSLKCCPNIEEYVVSLCTAYNMMNIACVVRQNMSEGAQTEETGVREF